MPFIFGLTVTVLLLLMLILVILPITGLRCSHALPISVVFCGAIRQLGIPSVRHNSQFTSRASRDELEHSAKITSEVV